MVLNTITKHRYKAFLLPKFRHKVNKGQPVKISPINLKFLAKIIPSSTVLFGSLYNKLFSCVTRLWGNSSEILYHKSEQKIYILHILYEYTVTFRNGLMLKRRIILHIQYINQPTSFYVAYSSSVSGVHVHLYSIS